MKNELITTTDLKALPTKGLTANARYTVKLFNEWALEHGGNIPLFFKALNRDGYSSGSMRVYRGHLKKAVRLHLENQGMDTGRALAAVDILFKTVKVPKSKEAVDSDQVITANELAVLGEKCGPKTALLIQALYWTAARVSELLNVRLDECEKIRGGVAITVHGTKTNQDRRVFLPRDIYTGICKAYHGKTFLFETRKGTAMSRITAYFLIREAGKYLGREIHPHLLRHSFASARVADLGVDKLSAYLGHASAGTTARYYLHNRPTAEDVLGAVG